MEENNEKYQYKLEFVRPMPDFSNRSEVREWWHGILRESGKFPCYGIFLLLSSDKNMAHYLVEHGFEIGALSGDNCLIIFMGNRSLLLSNLFNMNSPGRLELIIDKGIDAHIYEGHSVRVANIFDIKYDELPSLVLFSDVRSPWHTIISFKDMEVSEISKNMRSVFSVIHDAVSKKENPIVALQKSRHQDNFQKAGKSIVGQLRTFADKTFEIAMEAWIKANIS